MNTTFDPLNQFRLDGKVALVTGGSRGLGKEMVLAFARVGADVIIASRKLEACEALAEQVRNETGQRAMAIAYHAASWSDADGLAQQALDEFGRVDVLVNNAGMSPLYDDLLDVSEGLWDKVTGVNQKGPFRLTVLIASEMKEGDGGSIIGVSSIAAIAPTAGELAYGAAKAALNNMTLGFADAYAPKVRVNCIMPGAFLTDISQAWPPEFHEMVEQRALLNRGGRPDEIVGTALYLASDASSYVTGSIIKVDGGAS